MSEDMIERDVLIDAPVERVWSLVSAPGFWVADPESVKGTTAQLNAAGVEWISVADRAKGKFGTFADPDGNYLQIIEWKKDS